MMARLVPDYYVVTDVNIHDDNEQLSEAELRLRAEVHFGLTGEQLESALNGHTVVTTDYKIEPGYVETYTTGAS